MSLRITLSVNGATIDDIEIVNRGPLQGQYEPGDHAGGPGARRYEWRTLDGRLSGIAFHARSDGAHALAVNVLRQIRQADDSARQRARVVTSND